MKWAFLALLGVYTAHSLVVNRGAEEKPPQQGGADFHFFDFVPLWNFATDSPAMISRFLAVAFVEEIIWRATAQPVLIEVTGHAVPGMLMVAVGFSIVHKHFFRNEFEVSAEFLGFSLLLGVLYYLTGSLILVVIIHTVRDIEIAYIEYLVKVRELGDKEAAAKDVEGSYGPQRPGTPVPLIVYITQTPLFIVACYLAMDRDVFSRQLVSPLYIGLGLLAGHLIFSVSLLVTHRSS